MFPAGLRAARMPHLEVIAAQWSMRSLWKAGPESHVQAAYSVATNRTKALLNTASHHMTGPVTKHGGHGRLADKQVQNALLNHLSLSPFFFWGIKESTRPPLEQKLNPCAHKVRVLSGVLRLCI